MSRGDWKGVTWPPIIKGRCTRHDTIVGVITLTCHECHQEQLANANPTRAKDTKC